jgi:hypothetical protein
VDNCGFRSIPTNDRYKWEGNMTKRQAKRHGLAGLMFAGILAAGTAVAAPEGCPTEPEVHASVERYITKDWWTKSQRETWLISDVSDFAFGSVTYGNPSYGQCPVRVEYSFKVTHTDGRVEVTRKGVGETFSFGRNNFAEWIFSVGS